MSIPAIGFRNTGSICYFNSLLQCLLSPRFIEFLKVQDPAVPHSDLFVTFLRDITNDQWNITFSTLLLQALQLLQPNQSSSEYFLSLVDRMKWEPAFETRHRIARKCQECGHLSEMTDITYNPLICQSFSELLETDCTVHDVTCDGCQRKTTRIQTRTLTHCPLVMVLSLNKYV